jgi:hypothetical protein
MSFINCTVLLTRHYSGDQIKKNEMDRECGRYGRQDSGFRWGDLRERANLEDFGVDGMGFHSEDLHCLYSLRDIVRKIR